MNISNWKQMHALWITIWEFLKKSEFKADSGAVTRAILTYDKDPAERAGFWPKFEEALRELMLVPNAVTSSQFTLTAHIPSQPTRDALDLMYTVATGDTVAKLRKLLPETQPSYSNEVFSNLLFETSDLGLILKQGKMEQGGIEVAINPTFRTVPLGVILHIVKTESLATHWNTLGTAVFFLAGKDGKVIPIGVTSRRRLLCEILELDGRVRGPFTRLIF